MSRFTDIHAHVIYGVDDGAKTREDMEAMLDAAYADGVGTLMATPHQIPGVKPFDNALFQEHLAEARQYCRSKRYDLKIFAGAELLYTPMLKQYARENQLQTYQGRDYVLLEFVPDIAYREIDEALTMLESYGYDVVIAHVERYDCLARHAAYRLKEKHPVRFQMNCDTVIEDKGFLRNRRIRQWLKDELIDAVASDAHNCSRRKTRMTEAYQRVAADVSAAYARKITGKK